MKNKIEVYHFNMEKALENGRSMFFMSQQENKIEALIEDKLYQKVAEVETSDLEEAFNLTSHIDNPWQENKKVTSFSQESRSTSPGDLFVIGDKLFTVSSIGFTEMPEKFKELLEKSTKQDKKPKIK